MRSHYKRIGDYVTQVKLKNIDGSISDLKGININKYFMPSVANINGTDLSKYLVVKKNQFAFNPMHVGRDEVLPISMLEDDEPIIVSPAYVVFKVKDEEKLLPEYLMMWSRRSEFDRHAWFMTDNSVRGGFSWADFCDMELPVPSIEKQREIVREYNVVNDRISLNEKLTQKLEDTAQAIYKQWFVDFEFPISKEYAESIGKPELEGKPYKSAGGEMEYCKVMGQNIPVKWNHGYFSDLSTQFSGYSFKGEDYSFIDGVTVIRGENVSEGKLRFDTHKKWSLQLPRKTESCFLKEKDILIGMDGSKVGKNWALISPYQLPLLLAQRVCCIRAKELDYQLWLYISIKVRKFSEYVSQVYTGTSVPHISGEQIMSFEIIIPSDDEIIKTFNRYVKVLFNQIFIKQKEISYLVELKNIVLQKISTA